MTTNTPAHNRPESSLTERLTRGALVDTNVVLDALANRKPWAKDAQDLLFLASQGKAALFVSGSTITDVFYLANKHVYHDPSRSIEVIRILLDSLSVVDVGFDACLHAAYSSIADYEDAVVAEAARQANLGYIVTRNEKDFAQSPVSAISPHEFLALLLGESTG